MSLPIIRLNQTWIITGRSYPGAGMLQMKKIDIAELKRASAGQPPA
jgi:hypothetical protein